MTETPDQRQSARRQGHRRDRNAIASTPAVYNAVMDALAPFGVAKLDMPLTPGEGLARDPGARGGSRMYSDHFAYYRPKTIAEAALSS